MLFYNEYEIEQALERYRNHPVLSKATRFLNDFKNEVNSHSDGWPYWSAPVYAAAKLITLIQNPETATETGFKKALAPIRAFYTRKGTAAGLKFPEIDSDIYERYCAKFPAGTVVRYTDEYRRKFAIGKVTSLVKRGGLVPTAHVDNGYGVPTIAILADNIEPVDFELSGGGSVYLLKPLTDAAKEWVNEHIGEDNGFQPYWPTITIEHRYIEDIVNGIQNDGLTVA